MVEMLVIAVTDGKESHSVGLKVREMDFYLVNLSGNDLAYLQAAYSDCAEVDMTEL